MVCVIHDGDVVGNEGVAQVVARARDAGGLREGGDFPVLEVGGGGLVAVGGGWAEWTRWTGWTGWTGSGGDLGWGWGRDSGGVAGAWGDGDPVVSRCATTGYRPAPLGGIRVNLRAF